jgi:lysozyme family protein
MDRPAVLPWLYDDEVCNAQGFHRRTVTTQLYFLLSTLFLKMEHDTADRFMRDSIRGCYGAEWLLLLYYIIHHGRPFGNGNTVRGVLCPGR